MTSADTFFNLFSGTFPPHHYFLFLTSTVEGLNENYFLGAQWLSGRVVDLRPRGRRFEPYRPHCVVSLSKNINPSLVLVQPRKTSPFIIERLLMGRKESNQTNKRELFYWMSLFSLKSRLPGEPCDLFLISYSCPELRCIFCIAWCQQISIWNKRIESSINLKKQVGKFFKT